MNLEEMTREELEARAEELREAVDACESVDEVQETRTEFDAVKAEIEKRKAAELAEIEARKAEAAKKAEVRAAVAEGAGEVLEKEKREEEKVEVEVRNSKAYIDAYAEYVKTGDAKECRALLSTNGTNVGLSLTGYVPVPDFVEGMIRTAWEENNVLSLVRKSYVKGNLKVAFELSADGADVHVEGDEEPDEEEITLGVVTLTPVSVKKWITVSDEALDLAGEEFLRYIFDELSYRIAKKAEEVLVGKIAALPDTATSSSVSAAVIAAEPAVDTIAQAMGSVVGKNLTIVMNRATWAAFKAVQYAANFAIDIFEGQKVVFTDALPALSAASEDDVYAIIGDFEEGALANFPNGEGIKITVDNLSLAEKDLVKFVGREFVAMEAVADKRFCLLAVPENP